LEKKLELLTKENQRLADQVKKSEKESEEMTKAVINKLR
jgi:chaperonin cofactor prefoldin